MARDPLLGRHPAFQMPSVQTMVSRKSSITNAFVNAIIPAVQPTFAEVEEALAILGIDPAKTTCAYCGDQTTEWDHFRPLVLNRRPTGFISEIANLVPCCGKCNQSKGNKNWKLWIRGTAKLSPASRKVPDLERRISRLEAFEGWRNVVPLEIEKILGPEVWKGYWETYDKTIDILRQNQGLADKLKQMIAASRS